MKRAGSELLLGSTKGVVGFDQLLCICIEPQDKQVVLVVLKLRLPVNAMPTPGFPTERRAPGCC